MRESLLLCELFLVNGEKIAACQSHLLSFSDASNAQQWAPMAYYILCRLYTTIVLVAAGASIAFCCKQIWFCWARRRDIIYIMCFSVMSLTVKWLAFWAPDNSGQKKVLRQTHTRINHVSKFLYESNHAEYISWLNLFFSPFVLLLKDIHSISISQIIQILTIIYWLLQIWTCIWAFVKK